MLRALAAALRKQTRMLSSACAPGVSCASLQRALQAQHAAVRPAAPPATLAREATRGARNARAAATRRGMGASASGEGVGDSVSKAPPMPPPPPLPSQQLYERPFEPGEVCSVLVRGVTFDNRQAAVQSLELESPLLFVREPENPVDQTAVAVQTLSGVPLGYVPRELSRHWVEDSACGRVHSLGVNPAGIAWLVAHSKPLTPGLLADLHPVDQQAPPLSHAWLAERQALLKHTGRCAACDKAEEKEVPLSLHVRWRHDPRLRVSSAVGASALCPECSSGRRLLPYGSQRAAAMRQLRRVNGWSVDEAAEYVRWVDAERQRREELGVWTIDLSLLLQSLGLTPEEVAAAEQAERARGHRKEDRDSSAATEPPF